MRVAVCAAVHVRRPCPPSAPPSASPSATDVSIRHAAAVRVCATGKPHPRRRLHLLHSRLRCCSRNMSSQMSTQPGQLVSNSRSEEEIRRKRKKQKRVVVVLAVSIMAIIANRYQRRRTRHIVDPEEALERNVEGRKQMLRNLYQGSNIYCYNSLRLTKRSFGDLCAILRVRCGLNVSVEEKWARAPKRGLFRAHMGGPLNQSVDTSTKC
ncbi:hypothetical protein EJB05_01636, partial [Eragrostis curvula]